MLRLFKPPLFIREPPELIRINTLEPLLQIIPLLEQRHIRAAEFIQLRLVRCAIHVQHPRPIPLDVQAGLIGRNHILARVFEFQRHVSNPPVAVCDSLAHATTIHHLFGEIPWLR